MERECLTGQMSNEVKTVTLREYFPLSHIVWLSLAPPYNMLTHFLTPSIDQVVHVNTERGSPRKLPSRPAVLPFVFP